MRVASAPSGSTTWWSGPAAICGSGSRSHSASSWVWLANVLSDMDLPSRALGWTLGSFTLGAEAGHLLVVMIAASAVPRFDP